MWEAREEQVQAEFLRSFNNNTDSRDDKCLQLLETREQKTKQKETCKKGRKNERKLENVHEEKINNLKDQLGEC